MSKLFLSLLVTFRIDFLKDLGIVLTLSSSISAAVWKLRENKD